VIHVYSLARPVAMISLAGHDPASPAGGRIVSSDERPGWIELNVQAEGPGVVVFREAFSPSWTARVNGIRRTVLRADGRHVAVEVPQGPARVTLRYRPRSLGAGFASMLVSGLALVALWWTGDRGPRKPPVD